MKPHPPGKVYKIGPFRIRSQTLCMLSLVLIMVFSSFGYIAGNFGTSEQPAEQLQVRVVINFGNFSQYDKPLSLEKAESAYFVFKKVANLTTEQTINGLVPVEVSIAEHVKTNTEKNKWVFYVNGRITFDGLDNYEVKNADTIELRYEEKLY